MKHVKKTQSQLDSSEGVDDAGPTQVTFVGRHDNVVEHFCSPWKFETAVQAQEVAAVVEHQMQLDGVHGATELCPVIHPKDRLYPPLTTLRLFIGQVLSEDRACQDVVGRHLPERIGEGRPGCGLNTGPYCQARQRLPLAIPQRLLRRVGKRLEARMPKA